MFFSAMSQGRYSSPLCTSEQIQSTWHLSPLLKLEKPMHPKAKQVPHLPGPRISGEPRGLLQFDQNDQPLLWYPLKEIIYCTVKSFLPKQAWKHLASLQKEYERCYSLPAPQWWLILLTEKLDCFVNWKINFKTFACCWGFRKDWANTLAKQLQSWVMALLTHEKLFSAPDQS